jgi:transposase
MNHLVLTEKEKLFLEEQHQHSKNVKERDRIKAVLLRSEGWSYKMIAQALRLQTRTISRHIEDYLVLQKLQIDSGGSEVKLNKDQTEQLITHLSEHTYSHQKEIIVYIKKTFGISYVVSGLHKWLHRNRFSYKKPKGLPYKADVEQQADFIKAYNELKQKMAADEAIYFMDAVHPTQATKITSGWIRTGTDKPIETTGSRTRLNIVGAIELGRLSQTVAHQYEKVNAETIIEFLTSVRWQSANTGTIYLVLDGAGYHRAGIVKEKARELDIKLIFLPPYSPNLNPIERLWKVMNEKVRNNKFFNNAKEFRQQINLFFEQILPEIGHSLDTRINDNFQVFKQTF